MSEDAGQQSFTVILNHSYSQDVTVHYTTQDHTASGGVDYQITSGTLTIPAGQTTGQIMVPIIRDPGLDGQFEVLVAGRGGLRAVGDLPVQVVQYACRVVQSVVSVRYRRDRELVTNRRGILAGL